MPRDEDLLRLPIARARIAIANAFKGDYVGPGGGDVLELEVVAAGGDRYRCRGLRGHRTTNAFDTSPQALPANAWISRDSMFIEIIATPGRYGGVRYWFRCPRSACGRRCSVLYRERTTNARAFTCRVCAGLRYASQVLGRADLALHRVARKLSRLEFKPGEVIAKPKGMHRRTFDRLRREVEPLLTLWAMNDPLMKRLTAATDEVNAAILRSGAIPPPMFTPKLDWQP